ncbi:MAG: hypothetical protein K2Z81_03200 [Cyanobacteria bacterium]|nr:hypothetical protein [Cyanobacteriota bacterium]
MSIEYLIDLQCPIKDQFPNELLISKVKGRKQAEAILAMAQEEGDVSASELVIKRVLYTPEGEMEQEEVTIQALIDESEDVYSMEEYCTECPANPFQQPFGCYGNISYPILSDTEQWLVSLLPDHSQSEPLNLLLRYLQDFDLDGGAINEMRKDSTFFESREPAVKTWTDQGVMGRMTGKKGQAVNSSQLLEILFGVGPLEPAHSLSVLYYLNFIPHNTSVEEFAEALRMGSVDLIDFSSFKYDPEYPQRCDFNDFFISMASSVAVGSVLLIDF